MLKEWAIKDLTDKSCHYIFKNLIPTKNKVDIYRAFVFAPDFSVTVLAPEMCNNIITFCDNDIVSQSCSKMPNLMLRQRENVGAL